ncbi:glycosyltransferase, partial [Amylibacter sp.]|nr:glycosyltransferase [Amylibacter sp.]
MKISIITVTFNSENYIKDCLNSVINQSHEDIEHIIVDGNSTDRTVKIIESMKIDNLKMICEPDDGIYDAMNKGIDLCSGDIIGIL